MQTKKKLKINESEAKEKEYKMLTNNSKHLDS